MEESKIVRMKRLQWGEYIYSGLQPKGQAALLAKLYIELNFNSFVETA